MGGVYDFIIHYIIFPVSDNQKVLLNVFVFQPTIPTLAIGQFCTTREICHKVVVKQGRKSEFAKSFSRFASTLGEVKGEWDGDVGKRIFCNLK